MLLVPHILGSRIADWTEQATRSHAVYRYTPNVYKYTRRHSSLQCLGPIL